MEIDVVEKGSHTDILVYGLISRIWEAEEIIDRVEARLADDPVRPIRLIIRESFTIPSRLIGALINFIRNERAELEVIPEQQMLYQLFDRLNLVGLLNVRGVGNA